MCYSGLGLIVWVAAGGCDVYKWRGVSVFDGLDWIGFDWIGSDWRGRAGAFWACLDWIGLVGWIDWIGLDWIGLNWIGSDCIASIGFDLYWIGLH